MWNAIGWSLKYVFSTKGGFKIALIPIKNLEGLREHDDFFSNVSLKIKIYMFSIIIMF